MKCENSSLCDVRGDVGCQGHPGPALSLPFCLCPFLSLSPSFPLSPLSDVIHVLVSVSSLSGIGRPLFIQTFSVPNKIFPGLIEGSVKIWRQTECGADGARAIREQHNSRLVPPPACVCLGPCVDVADPAPDAAPWFGMLLHSSISVHCCSRFPADRAPTQTYGCLVGFLI